MLRTGVGSVAALLVVLGATACAGSSSPASTATWTAGALLDPDAIPVLQAEDGGADTVILQRADGAERHAILEGQSDAEHPDVSPDGLTVAYKSVDEKDEIWVADIDGGDPHVIVDCADPGCFGTDFPAWSPDGSLIAFTAYAPPPDAQSPPAGSSIEVVDVGSGEVRSLASSDPGDILDNARWSPDGRSLVVQIDHFDDGEETSLTVATIDIEKGGVTRLTDGSLFGGYPDWSPDGDRIVFASYDLGAFAQLPEGASSNLYTVSPDGSDVTQLTRLTPNGQRATQPSWTRDGRAILVTAVGVDGSRAAAIVPVSGGDVIPLDVSPATHVREASLLR